MPATQTVLASGNPDIDGVLSGVRWQSPALTYSFPTSASYYGSPYTSSNEPSSFSVLTTVQQTAATTVLKMYAAVSGLTFSLVTETASVHATLRYAMSSAPSTAWAYYPANDSRGVGGDVWLNKTYYGNPVLGTYAFATFLHETGHALGLKHGQEVDDGFPALPSAHDSLEYSVMTYRAFVGDPLTSGGYTVESGGYPQSLMMDDIAALQYMYGANFSTYSGNTVYSWSPTTGEEFINGVGQGRPSANRVFMTVWDGGGVDTYDLSNYATALSVNLTPGNWSTISTAQLSHLDFYGSNTHLAAGNIANALLYQGDPRSLIENATGGSGNDTIIGNIVANVLMGGAGDDRLDGEGGNDSLFGGDGTDTAVYNGARASYQITLNGDGSLTVVDLRAGSPDGTDTLYGFESLQFSDRASPYGVGELFGRQVIANPDGTSTIIVDDTLGQFVWTRDASTFDVQGRLLREDVDYDDGTHSITVNDIQNTRAWTRDAATFDSQWRLTREDVDFDDGTHKIIVNDLQGQQAWSRDAATFDSQWRLAREDVDYDDGTHVITVNDLSNEFAWTRDSISYDGQWRISRESLDYDDGTHSVSVFDLQNQQAWAQDFLTYDSHFRVTREILTWDDGTYRVSDFDAGNQYAWTSIISTYDAQWHLTSRNVYNDDGTILTA